MNDSNIGAQVGASENSSHARWPWLAMQYSQGNADCVVSSTKALQSSMTTTEHNALDRLFKRTFNAESLNGQVAAKFLLAWWNAGQGAAFHFYDLFNCDESTVHDIATVCSYFMRARELADIRGYTNQFMTLSSQ